MLLLYILRNNKHLYFSNIYYYTQFEGHNISIAKCCIQLTGLCARHVITVCMEKEMLGEIPEAQHSYQVLYNSIKWHRHTHGETEWLYHKHAFP